MHSVVLGVYYAISTLFMLHIAVKTIKIEAYWADATLYISNTTLPANMRTCSIFLVFMYVACQLTRTLLGSIVNKNKIVKNK